MPFSEGLPPNISAGPLAVSPDGRWLYAGTDASGVYALDLVPREPCTASATRLCLVGNRYAVDLLASRRGGGETGSGEARPLSDRAGYFSLPFVTGDSELPEVLVKVLPDGTFGPGAPVFYSSLTTLPFTLTVTDTATGQTESYANASEAPLCGRADIAFGDAAPAPESMGTAKAARADSEDALRLLGGRFEVTLTARHARTGRTATGHGVFRSERFGYFSFPAITGDAEFPEVFVKMLDFRSITGSFLLFHAGLTGFDYTLTVTDTITGAVRTVESAADFCGAVATLSPGP